MSYLSDICINTQLGRHNYHIRAVASISILLWVISVQIQEERHGRGWRLSSLKLFKVSWWYFRAKWVIFCAEKLYFSTKSLSVTTFVCYTLIFLSNSANNILDVMTQINVQTFWWNVSKAHLLCQKACKKKNSFNKTKAGTRVCRNYCVKITDLLLFALCKYNKGITYMTSVVLIYMENFIKSNLSKYLQPGSGELMYPGLSTLSSCRKARHQHYIAFVS